MLLMKELKFNAVKYLLIKNISPFYEIWNSLKKGFLVSKNNFKI